MNRLILLGNGFDLAHGMKTSYNDFILDYIIKCLTEANQKKSYVNEVMEITTNNTYYVFEHLQWNSMADLVKDLYNTKGLKALFADESFSKGSSSLRNIFKIKCKCPFIKNLLLKCDHCNWVEIENEYYSALTSIINSQSAINKEKEIASLNLSLHHIITKLQEYLSGIAKANYSIEYNDIIRSRIREQEFVMPEISAYSQPGKTMILNFNYTETIESYLEMAKGSLLPNEIMVNYIHGQLNNPNNPIIFGFGDEMDKDYATLEMHRTKGLLEYIKSFWYNKTTNYHELIRFIEAEYFQVLILGHSCGLSDRTMLNMIFEHENCQSIKIYYYKDKEGQTNYTELTQEISRNFMDKRSMRRKIVPFPLCAPMPQVNSI